MSAAKRDGSTVYGVYRVGGRTFVVPLEPTGEDGALLPRFPLFDPPQYDARGRPYAFACSEGCEHFQSKGKPGAKLCCDCVYLRGDPIGLCTHPKRKRAKE